MLWRVDSQSTFMYIGFMPESQLSSDLKEILKMKGVTHSRLCRDLKIDQGHLSRFLSGRTGMSLENLERMADYLGYEVTFDKKKEEGNKQSKKPMEREKIAKEKLEKVIEEIENLCERKIKAIDIYYGGIKINWE